MIAHRGRVWTGEAWLDDAVVELYGPMVYEVRRPTAEDPPHADGLIVPGLVNAHTHLEFSWAAGRVPPSTDFNGWVRNLLGQQAGRDRSDDLKLAAEAAAWVHEAGTAVLFDISNGGNTAELMVRSGLAGVVQHELLGFHLPDQAQKHEAAAVEDQRTDGSAGPVWRRPGPHGPPSTPPELIVAASRPGVIPASIHLAEDPSELELLLHKTGPVAAFLDEIRRDWRWWTPPGCSPVAYLDQLGVLGPDLMLVHARHLTDDDRQRMASAGAPVVLCPRSNLHIGGYLADVPALIAAGIPLCLGTDSLASAPDLDVLGEVAVLIEAHPELDPLLWLRAATSGGADVLRFADRGRLTPGTAPGVLWLDGVRSPADLVQSPERRWLARPSASANVG